MDKSFRKNIKDEIKTFFITTVTDERLPFFKEDIFCELFIENLRLCKKMKKFALYGFVILYEHAHMLIEPMGEFDISQIMHAIKRHFSRNANLIIGNTTNNVGGVCKPRLQDFYLKAHEFNKNILIYRELFLKKYGPNHHPFPKFMWQEGFYDHIIRGDRDFSNCREYIYNNCYKHRIWKNPDTYKWSDINQEWQDAVDVSWE